MDDHEVDVLAFFRNFFVVGGNASRCRAFDCFIAAAALCVVGLPGYHRRILRLFVSCRASCVMAGFLALALSVQQMDRGIESGLRHLLLDVECIQDLTGLRCVQCHDPVHQCRGRIQDPALFRHFVLIHHVLCLDQGFQERFCIRQVLRFLCDAVKSADGRKSKCICLRCYPGPLQLCSCPRKCQVHRLLVVHRIYFQFGTTVIIETCSCPFQ